MELSEKYKIEFTVVQCPDKYWGVGEHGNIYSKMFIVLNGDGKPYKLFQDRKDAEHLCAILNRTDLLEESVELMDGYFDSREPIALCGEALGSLLANIYILSNENDFKEYMAHKLEEK